MAEPLSTDFLDRQRRAAEVAADLGDPLAPVMLALIAEVWRLAEVEQWEVRPRPRELGGTRKFTEPDAARRYAGWLARQPQAAEGRVDLRVRSMSRFRTIETFGGPHAQ